MPVLVEHLEKNMGDDLVVVSPDAGRVKVAERYANALHADLAIVHKRRIRGAQNAVEAKQVHRVITVPAPEAMKWSRQLAQKEGIFVGISAGGTFAAAIEVANGAEKGSTILCMLPDTGERYLTTPMFEGIVEDMDEEERAISRSTPGYQMP